MPPLFTAPASCLPQPVRRSGRRTGRRAGARNREHGIPEPARGPQRPGPAPAARSDQGETRRRIGVHHGLHFAPDLGNGRFVTCTCGFDHKIDPLRDRARLGRGDAAGGERRGADADPGRVEGLTGVVRHGVVVDDDPRPVERLGHDLAGDPLGREVGQQHVVVRAAGDEVEAARREFLAQRTCVGGHLAGVRGEFGSGRPVSRRTPYAPVAAIRTLLCGRPEARVNRDESGQLPRDLTGFDGGGP